MARKFPFPLLIISAMFVLTVAILIPTIPQLRVNFISDGFTPHGESFLWQPLLLQLFAVSHIIVSSSFIVIAGVTVYFVYKSHQNIPFPKIFLALAGFAFICGIAQFMEFWALWTPIYWLSSTVQFITALASLVTVVMLPPLIPKALALVENAKASEARRKELLVTNEKLQVEIAERQRVVEALSESEERLRNALVKERELNELKSRFINTMSHEFRTPLAIISTSSDLLKNYGHKLDEQQRISKLSTIQNEIRNISRLLEDVLTIGRANAQRQEFDPMPLDLEGLCSGIVQDMGLTVSSKHKIEFKSSYTGGEVVMDARVLMQALNNLLSNALKYSPNGGTVTLDLSNEGECALISVKDEGIGIPKADKDRVFETFHRASNIGMISGTGLGLAIVKHAVRLHGGTINVESEEGKGTTFTLKLPFKPLEDTRSKKPQAEMTIPKTKPAREARPTPHE